MGLNDTNSLSHTRWNCKYHIVFAPKYRRKVFYQEKREAVRQLPCHQNESRVKQVNEVRNADAQVERRKRIKFWVFWACPIHCSAIDMQLGSWITMTGTWNSFSKRSRRGTSFQPEKKGENKEIPMTKRLSAGIPARPIRRRTRPDICSRCLSFSRNSGFSCSSCRTPHFKSIKSALRPAILIWRPTI